MFVYPYADDHPSLASTVTAKHEAAPSTSGHSNVKLRCEPNRVGERAAFAMRVQRAGECHKTVREVAAAIVRASQS